MTCPLCYPPRMLQLPVFWARAAPHEVWGLRQAQTCRGQSFPAVGFRSQRTGNQAAHYTRHMAWEKAGESKWKMSGAWTKDRKVWILCQKLRLIHSSRVGLHRR